MKCEIKWGGCLSDCPKDCFDCWCLLKILKYIQYYIFHRLCDFNELFCGKRRPTLSGRLGYWRPLRARGLFVIICWWAIIRQYIHHKTIKGYCTDKCRFCLWMTCMESAGYSEECRLGHWRYEAT